MDNNNNPSQNNLNHNVYESNFTESLNGINGLNSHSNHLQEATNIQDGNTNPNDTSYNYNNVIHTNISDLNCQQQYDVLDNYQQYIQQPDISTNTITITPDHNHYHNFQQPMSNVASNNNVTISSDNNHRVNIPRYNNQQSTSNNVSPPTVYHDQNQPNPLYSNILHSFGININSQATIIILPTTNSDTQSQLQQVLTHLNHTSSTDYSKT
jgi:hypothetical protein